MPRATLKYLSPWGHLLLPRLLPCRWSLYALRGMLLTTRHFFLAKARGGNCTLATLTAEVVVHRPIIY
ncbi:hypothetical protein AXF42_Ash021474 [Apostasia shenzhenica]|uniref:Uncharacterized protein n=1 Tax=Apostasia shenzhenica TaxID=1088818 RepID=A0A2H9ZSM3_9ASPA|nr:hypothetical protein AXF42_Ash021474 [Apostasia shenzhenica]